MNNPPIILIVDDDWMNRELLQAQLQAYHLISANKGDQALQLAQSQPPDLALLDLRLPGMSGYEVCARLKAAEPTRHTPVLIVSALEGDEARQKALEAGADDFLAKPFDSVTLMARVGSLLRIKGLRDELERREHALWQILNLHLDPATARRVMNDYLKADA